MKNRAKLISMLVAVCMMITLLPAVAFAAATSEVKIGSVALNANAPYYHNGEDGAQGTADNNPTGANAIFDVATGTLTLNNLHIVNTTNNMKGIQWTYSGSGANDLIIVLPAGTTNIVKNNVGAAINGEYGWQTEQGGGSLTITGSGSLEIVGSSYGIWVWHNVVIEDNANVTVTGTSNVGIANNNKYGKILIKDNAKVTAHGGQYGIGCDTTNKFGNTLELQSGTITVTGNTSAFMKHPNTLGSAVNAGTIYVNSDTSDTGASIWDNTTPFTCYKYVGITSTAVTTYTATYHSNDGKDSQFTQTFSDGVAQNLKDNRFANNGLSFNSWNTKADGNGTKYADKASVTFTANTDLYAQWSTTPTPSPSPDNTTPTPTPDVPTVDASNGIDLWYNGGNSFGSSKGDVPTSVEIDGVPVAFNGSGSRFTVGCVSPNAKWVTVKWHGTTVTTNFTPDANATCSEINIPKTGDASVMAFALMAVVAAAGALRRK